MFIVYKNDMTFFQPTFSHLNYPLNIMCLCIYFPKFTRMVSFVEMLKLYPWSFVMSNKSFVLLFMMKTLGICIFPWSNDPGGFKVIITCFPDVKRKKMLTDWDWNLIWLHKRGICPLFHAVLKVFQQNDSQKNLPEWKWDGCARTFYLKWPSNRSKEFCQLRLATSTEWRRAVGFRQLPCIPGLFNLTWWWNDNKK